MKTLKLTALTFATIATLFTGSVFAQSLTRSQVQAELQEAIKEGNMIANENGDLLRDVYPDRYPKKETITKTRAEVKEELRQAIKEGNMIANENGDLLKDVYPDRYPQK